MQTNTKKLFHFHCKTYLFGIFEQTRLVYQGTGGAGGAPSEGGAGGQRVEQREAGEKKSETPEAKNAKLGHDADALQHGIDLHKANDNPKIKELASNAETKLAALKLKETQDNLSETDKAATLSEVRLVLAEADQRVAYEQTRNEVRASGETAKGKVDGFFKDPTKGLNVSDEANAKINKLAQDAAFTQKGMLDAELNSANELTFDGDKGGQELKLIKKELDGAEPGFRDGLMKVYNDFIAQRDSVAALDVAKSDPMKATDQVNGDLANAMVQLQNDPNLEAKTTQMKALQEKTLAALAGLKGSEQGVQRAQKVAEFKDALRAIVQPDIKNISASHQLKRDILKPKTIAEARAKMEELRSKSGVLMTKLGPDGKGGTPADKTAAKEAYALFKTQESYVKQLNAAFKDITLDPPPESDEPPAVAPIVEQQDNA